MCCDFVLWMLPSHIFNRVMFLNVRLFFQLVINSRFGSSKFVLSEKKLFIHIPRDSCVINMECGSSHPEYHFDTNI